MITIYGDLILDCYIRVEHVKKSPESIGDVYKIKDDGEYRLGGAAAVAALIRYYNNAKHCLVAPTSRDRLGNTLHELLNKCNVTHELDYIEKERKQTTVKYRHVCNKRLLADRFDKEEYYPYTTDFVPSRTLVISDYGKGSCHDIKNKIEAFRHTSNIIVDPAMRDWKDYKGAHVIKCNFAEGNAQVKWQLDKHNKKAFDFCGLAELLDCFLIVTNGPNRIQVYKHNTQIFVDIPIVDHPVDVTGAGDTITAILAAELDRTPKEITFKMITDALVIAAKYAAEQVKHLGVTYDLTFTS